MTMISIRYWISYALCRTVLRETLTVPAHSARDMLAHVPDFARAAAMTIRDLAMIPMTTRPVRGANQHLSRGSAVYA
jgi:hypothetical protein